MHRYLKHLYSCLSRASYQFDALSLEKRPVHLAFVVNETSVDVPSLTRLVGWCLESKIGCVSLYDHSGQIKGLHDSLVTSLVATATSSVHPTVGDEFKLVRVRNSARGEDSEVTFDLRNGSAGVANNFSVAMFFTLADLLSTAECNNRLLCSARLVY